MKLSKWAKIQGIHYKTAWDLFRKGKVPGAYKLGSGTIIVPEPSVTPQKIENVAIYARVSSSENKTNLDSQADRLVSFCNAKGWQVHNVVKEIGSGLNDERKKLIKLFEERKITRLVVEHKDRLSRFGVNYIKLLCQSLGIELIIVNTMASGKEDLMQDFVSLVTCFCARLYGLRRSKRQTEKLIKELQHGKKE